MVSNPISLRAAGAITFDPQGVLFVGDNKSGAVFAYNVDHGPVTADPGPFTFESIDTKIADALGVSANRLVTNGLAVHPTTHEPYLSLGVRDCGVLDPAIVRVSLDGSVHPLDLVSAKATVQLLLDVPDKDKTAISRVGQWPVPGPEFYEEKARTPLRSMAIVDMQFHNGELFVAGVSNQEFASTLRRIAYPFDGSVRQSQIEIYHAAHGRFESRAPIRAMQFATLDGVETLIAAYACSPLVTIPVTDLMDGTKVRGKTIGDMGNGQPISMIAYQENGEAKLFITNVGRGPLVIPLSGIASSEGYTPENRPGSGMVVDTSPLMPMGPMGKEVLFVGSSLRAALFTDTFFVSLTRYADSGDLTLETLPVSPLPARLDKIWVEFDFPGGEMKAPQP